MVRHSVRLPWLFICLKKHVADDVATLQKFNNIHNSIELQLMVTSFNIVSNTKLEDYFLQIVQSNLSNEAVIQECKQIYWKTLIALAYVKILTKRSVGILLKNYYLLIVKTRQFVQLKT